MSEPISSNPQENDEPKENRGMSVAQEDPILKHLRDADKPLEEMFEGIVMNKFVSLEQMYTKCVGDGGALHSQKESLDNWIKQNIEEQQQAEETDRKKHVEELRALLTYYYLDDARRRALFSEEAARACRLATEVASNENISEKDSNGSGGVETARQQLDALGGNFYNSPETTISNGGGHVIGRFESEEERNAAIQLAEALSIVSLNMRNDKKLKEEFIAAMKAQGCECKEEGKKLDFAIPHNMKFNDILPAVNSFIREYNLSITAELGTARIRFSEEEVPAVVESLNKMELGTNHSKNLRYLLPFQYKLNDRLRLNPEVFKAKIKEQLNSWETGFSSLADVDLFWQGMKCLEVGDKTQAMTKLNSVLSNFTLSFGSSSDVKDIYLAVKMLGYENLGESFKDKLRGALKELSDVKGIENRLPEKEKKELAKLLGREAEVPKMEEEKKEKPKGKDDEKE